MLRLIALEGVTHESGVAGHESSCDLHFLAEADKKMEGSAIDRLAVSLHCALFDRTSGRVAETVRLLGALNDASMNGPARDVEQALASGKTGVKTSCAFSQDTFFAFRADPYKGGKPLPLPHSNDANNYAHFADAVKKLSGQFLGFSTYDDWATFNRVANDEQGSTMIPDRKHSGNIATWPSEFSNIADSRRDFMRYYSEAARHFMNMCESLAELCGDIDEAKTEVGYQALLKTLNGIVAHDVPVDFIKATLLALIGLAQRPARNVLSGVDGQTLTVSFEI
jgi:hypothetical protein